MEDQKNINVKIDEAKGRIVVSTSDAQHVLHTDQILYCRSSNTYTTFYCVNEQPLTTSYSIHKVEKTLEKHGFIRIHQSFLVNTKYIKSFQRSGTPEIIMMNEVKLPVSIRRKKILMNYFDGIEHIHNS